jgi:hypothetical protein
LSTPANTTNPRRRPTGLSAVSTVVSGPLGRSQASPGDAGLGLASMAERAALYGGTVSAGPAPDDGWTGHVNLKGSHS